MLVNRTRETLDRLLLLPPSPLALSALAVAGLQPLHPGLALLGCPCVAPLGHGMRDLGEDMLVLHTAPQAALDGFTPPDVDQDLGLAVHPWQLWALRGPKSSRGR